MDFQKTTYTDQGVFIHGNSPMDENLLDLDPFQASIHSEQDEAFVNPSGGLGANLDLQGFDIFERMYLPTQSDSLPLDTLPDEFVGIENSQLGLMAEPKDSNFGIIADGSTIQRTSFEGYRIPQSQKTVKDSITYQPFMANDAQLAKSSDVTGKLGYVSQSTRTSERVKTRTEKGFEYTLDLYTKQFNNAVANHVRFVKLCREVLKEGEFGVSKLTHLRNTLESSVVQVSDAFHKVVDLSPGMFGKLIEKLSECEATNRATLHEVTEALRELESRILPNSAPSVDHRSAKSLPRSTSSASHNSDKHSKSSHNSKSSSHKSKSSSSSKTQSHCSSHSKLSGKSVASLKFEAAAKAASLRAKLKYLEAENEHKVKLCKIKTMRRLETEEAKINAISDLQLPDDKPSDMHESIVTQPVIHPHVSVTCTTDQVSSSPHISLPEPLGLSLSGIDLLEPQFQSQNCVGREIHAKTSEATISNHNHRAANFQQNAEVHSHSIQHSPSLHGNVCDSLHVGQSHTTHGVVDLPTSTQGGDVFVSNNGVSKQSVVNCHDDTISAYGVNSNNKDAHETCNAQHLSSKHVAGPQVKFSDCNNSYLNCRAPEFVPQSQVALSGQPCGPQSLQGSVHSDRCESVGHRVPTMESSVVHNGIDPQTQQVSDLIRSFGQLLSVNRLPLPEPGVFNGDPLEYPSWKCAFTTLIESRDIAPAERIHYLRRYLGGKAKQCVESFLLMPTNDSYAEAISLIDKRFGDNFSIAQAFKAKIDSWPKITAKDYMGLRKFSDFLRQCEVAYRSNTSLRVLDDDIQNRAMLSKLPDWLVSRWARVVHRARTQGTYPPFAEFVAFLVQESEIACEPVVSLHSVPDKKNTQASQKNTQASQKNTQASQPSSATGRTCNTVKDSGSCLYCDKDNHILEHCKKLKSKSLDDKRTFILSKGLCFGCLRTGHFAKDCKKRLKCSDCHKSHPTVMHGEKPKDSAAASKDANRDGQDKKKGSTQDRNKKEKGEVSETVNHVSLFTNDHKIRTSTMVVPVYLSHQSDPETEVLT